MFLGEPNENWKRQRRRILLLIGALTLASLGNLPRAPEETEFVAASASLPKPHHPTVGVDGGHPLFLQLPDLSAFALPPPGVGTPETSAPAYGIPATVLTSYQRGARALAVTAPACHLTWPVLAGIGRVESNHANNGDVTASGQTVHPIFGPPLDGTNGTAAVKDSAGRWERAEGPMQFLPSTWAKWASGGDGDGRSDPQNVFDAAPTAGRYLCADSADLSTSDGLHQALLRYNPSEQYAETVTRWIRAYEHGGGPVPDHPSPEPRANGIREASHTDGAPSDSTPSSSDTGQRDLPNRKAASGDPQPERPQPPSPSAGPVPPPPLCEKVREPLNQAQPPGGPAEIPLECLVDGLLTPPQNPPAGSNPPGLPTLPQ